VSSFPSASTLIQNIGIPIANCGNGGQSKRGSRLQIAQFRGGGLRTTFGIKFEIDKTEHGFAATMVVCYLQRACEDQRLCEYW
jgi:hypothetical protein